MDVLTLADEQLAAQVGGNRWVRVLEPVVAASTEAVIWLGMKL